MATKTDKPKAKKPEAKKPEAKKPEAKKGKDKTEPKVLDFQLVPAAQMTPTATQGVYEKRCRVENGRLIIDPNTTFDEWMQLGGFFDFLHQNVQWFRADWVRFGETNFGEKYAQAIEATGLKYQTLANEVYVAERFSESERRHVGKLSFAHHAVVAPLTPKEQDTYLARAEKEGLTVAKLRELVAPKLKKRQGGGTTPSGGTAPSTSGATPTPAKDGPDRSDEDNDKYLELADQLITYFRSKAFAKLDPQQRKHWRGISEQIERYAKA